MHADKLTMRPASTFRATIVSGGISRQRAFCKLKVAKKFVLVNLPNCQTHLFRMRWQLLSVSDKRLLRFSIYRLPQDNSRKMCTCKTNGFKRPEMNTCRKVGGRGSRAQARHSN